MTTRQYALKLPEEEARLVDEICQAAHVSFNRVVGLCVRKAAGEVRESLLASGGRVTNVDPLPDETLREIYSRPERDEATIEALINAQPKGVRD